MKFWYEYRLRGHIIGCQPLGYIDYDSNYGVYGAIAYDRPLSEKEISFFDLRLIKEGDE